MSHPRQRPDQSLADHQADMARWLGCSVERMNLRHDSIHIALCQWLDVPCRALDPKTAHTKLADIEEEAVLHVQRLMEAHGR